MKKIIQTSMQFFTLLFLSITQATAATGTVVEIKDDEGVSTILTNGDFARMNSSDDEFVIVNLKNSQVNFVSPNDQEVMQIDIKAMPSGTQAPSVKVQLKNIGSGPTIANYDTEKFSYSVNNKECGVIYGSEDAAGADGIKELLNAMTAIVESSRSMMGGFSAMLEDCEQAESRLMDYIKTTGIPMRVEHNGKTVSEIKSIKVSEDLPKDAFTIPASYKTVTMQDKMMEAKQQMQKYEPQMQEMMKQMEQMDPKVKEQLRQVQDMMQKMQQR